MRSARPPCPALPTAWALLAAGGLAAVAPAAAAGEPLADELARIANHHGGTVLVLASDRHVLRAVAPLVPAEGTAAPALDIALRALSPAAEPRAAAAAALAATGLRCGAILHRRPPAPRVELVGDCQPAGATALAATVPRTTPRGRGELVESQATLSLSPALVSGGVQDLALELRTGPRQSVAFSATHVGLATLPGLAGGPASGPLDLTMLHMQLRRYGLGDADTGLYGLASLGGLHAEGDVAGASLGLARPGTSPLLGAGVGLKLTMPGGLTADAHLGAALSTLAPVLPMAGARLGWSWP